MRLRLLLLSTQDTYVQHKSGLADQITFDNGLTLTKLVLGFPVYRALWKSSRTSYAPEWSAYVDQLITKTSIKKPVDAVAQFKSDLAEVLR